MTVLVTDIGFAPDDWADNLANNSNASGNEPLLELAPDSDLTDIQDQLSDVRMIRVAFPTSADGRGFTIARQLRLHGYTGRLRAYGHILADQYAMARRAGFDEVEIDDDLAARQPQDQWLFRAAWQDHDYQSRLRG